MKRRARILQLSRHDEFRKSNPSPYLKHLFVCVNQRDPGETCCAAGGRSGFASSSESHAAGGRSGFASSSEGHAAEGGEAIKEKLKAYVRANGLKGKVRVSSSGCMDLCAQGPNVMVEPDHRWYPHVTLEDVDRIIGEELAPLAEIASAAARTRNDGHAPIRAFLFDLGNVLVRFDHMQAARQIAAHTRLSVEELFRVFFDSSLVVDHDEGRISTPAFYESLKRQIGLRVDYERFLQIWNDIFTEDRQMEELVGQLLPRYPCFLVSNTNRPHFEWCRRRYPVLDRMSGWILSYEVGHLKPHPAIYQRALELAKVPAAEIFYVDDREDLIDTARQIGFQVHRFEGVNPLRTDLEKRGISTARSGPAG